MQPTLKKPIIVSDRGYMLKTLITFLSKDIVFFIAWIVAIVTMFFIPPNFNYLTYMNFDVLIIMFTIMISVAGIYKTHFFDFIATKLVLFFKSIRLISLTLILSTFFLGMLLTNDAVLLTLVPFSVFILAHTKQTNQLIKVIILQTIAANMGSALTPMGDPQNIYLFSYYKPELFDFLSYTFPITLTGLILLIVTTLLWIPNHHVQLNLYTPHIPWKTWFMYMSVLFSALLHILDVIPIYLTLIYTMIVIIWYGKRIILSVDSHLLLTFVAFFIVTGNIAQIDAIREILAPLLQSPMSVYVTSLLSSQVISNVPSAVLLSTYTDPMYLQYLLQGVNVGSMGSLIGSLASLISLKYILKDYRHLFLSYLMRYTIISVIFIVIITIVLFI